MAIDQYAYCLCNSGKKIKFCCGKKVLPQLEKILRAIEDDQRLSALNQLDTAIAANGSLACLMRLKVEVLLALDKPAEVEEAIARFMAEHPGNVSALSLNLINLLPARDLSKLLPAMQTLCEASFEQKALADHTVEAIRILGEIALQEEEFMLARGCVLWRMNLLNDEQATEDFFRLERTSQPVVFKDQPLVGEFPSDAPWADEFKEIAGAAVWGAWRKAASLAEALSEKHPDTPAIMHFIARLYSFLCDKEKAPAAWRRYAALDTLTLAEAVEAEACAQCLDDSTEHSVDVVRVHFPIDNLDLLTEQLISNPRALAQEGDLARYATEDNVAPRNVFGLLDREPSTEDDQTVDDVAQALGVAYIFGKTTETEARLEYQALRDHRFDERLQLLQSIAGDCLGDSQEVKVIAPLAESVAVVFDSPHLPENLSPETGRRLSKELERKVYFVQWLNTPQHLFGGVSPAEACANPAMQLPLLASVLLAEYEQLVPAFDFNDLRRELNLPTREPFKPEVSVLEKPIRPMMLRLLVLEGLSTEEIQNTFQRSLILTDIPSGRRVGPLLLEQEGLSDEDREHIYRSLAQIAEEPAEALELIRKGRALAAQNERPVGQWLLAEADMLLRVGDAKEFERVLQTLSSRHMREPGVSEGVVRLLQSIGINPATMAAAGGAPPTAPAAAAEAGGLWTPDGPSTPSPASPPGEQKESGESKLWVPGMD